jgi:hypothetical protein
MPKLATKRHPRKEPPVHKHILKETALKGRLSQKDAAGLFNRWPSTISESLNIMRTKRKLIQFDAPPDFKSGERHKKFYKLTNNGLIAFIKEYPTAYEFWVALMWYCALNSEAVVNKNQLKKYYDLFIEKYVGQSFPLRSCFFLTDSFNNLFKKWRSMYDSPECNVPGTVRYFRHPAMIQTYQVLKCLLQNRAITIKRIIELTGLTEQQVRKTLEDYSISTQNKYSHYAELYESVYQSDRMAAVTIDYLNHLVIIPIEEKAAEGGNYDNKNEKYELSLLGVLLVLATVSLSRRENGQRISPSAEEDYGVIASNYHDKLPLIFGKWNLLKEVLKHDFFPSIFDYLFLDKAEILSLSVLLGGNKEIYDNIKSSALRTISKYSTVYNEGNSAIQSNDCPEEFLSSTHYKFIQDKLNEIEMSLRYADLESFAKYMISKKPKPDSPHVSLTFKEMPVWKVHKLFLNKKADDFDFKDDLQSIESTLADEFSLLLYVGLLRENNHKASDYPLTTGFIRPSPNLMYPKNFLIDIIRSDGKIREYLLEWIREANTYQRLALEKMNEIYAELQRK